MALARRIVLLVTLWLLAACAGNSPPQGGQTPTAIITLPSNTPEPPTLTLPPSATLPQLETATPTLTAEPPTLTLLPSETPGPYQHVVKSGETLGFIIQQYGYTDLSVAPGSIIDQVVQINPNIPNADTLPGEGAVIFIPRQTATPTPGNLETAVAVEATNTASSPNVVFSENANFADYNVQEGDTIIRIAQENNLTLEQIAVANPELNFSGCDFNIPSGGPRCNVPLQVGQAIKLPAPTPTPTLSPTPSGSETPTPTPTYLPPRLVYPPDSAVAQPGVFSLQWVGVGLLQANEFYLVEVTDVTANATPFRELTRDTSLTLPESLIPTDGQVHTFNWTVRVVTPNEQGAYRSIGGQPEIRAFQWLSR